MNKYTATDIINKRKQLWNKYKSIEKDRTLREATAQQMLQDKALRQEIKDNPELLIEMCFTIVDKNKELVPFFLNEVQQDFLQRINKAITEYKEGKRLHKRFLVLKGRQQGFSAVTTAYQLACTLTRKNFAGFTVADTSENTTSIFEDKAKQPYTLLPDPLKPSQKYNNKKEMFFDKINSSWRIATASKDIGRSKTINFLHASECAFWQVSISSIQAAIGEALTKYAIQVYESTACGYNEFKDLWDSGKWENCFYEWWRTSEYRFDFESEHKRKWFLSQIDTKEDWIWQRIKWLREEKQLDIAQLYWYYNKWDEKIVKDHVKQEYPCTPDEAFLASGKCVFDKEIIIQRKEYLKQHVKPIRQGFFEFKWNDADTKDKILDHTIIWNENPHGYIKIYEDYIENHHYVLGGDTAGDGSDNFTATVIDNCTGKRVASLKENLDPDTYTYQIYCLGKMYDTALISVEINFDIYPREELKRLNYPKQFIREQYDKMSKGYLKKYGWKTDGNTRPMIISKQITLMRDNIDLFYDIDYLDECLTFVYDKNMRPDAEVGKHDDLLLSDMIAEAARSQQNYTPTVTEDDKGVIWNHKQELAKKSKMRRRRFA